MWDKKNPMLGRRGVATQHEYVIWRSFVDGPVFSRSANLRLIVATARKIIAKHKGVSQHSRDEFTEWISSYPGLTGGERAYCLIDDDGRVYRGVAMGAPEPRSDPKFHIPLIHPVTNKKCPVPPNGWSRAPETLQELIARGEILFGEDESVQPQRKVFLTDESQRQLSSVIQDAGRGKADVEKLGLEFPYCHPLSLYLELVAAGVSRRNGIVIDFFAGSGTSGHAVIDLNREDGGRLRFILVEVADYFDTVMLARIQKVMFTPEWNDGKPVRMATKAEAERTPRLVKVLRLEGYEDALHNLVSDETLEREAPRAKAIKAKVGGDSYRLTYLARLPLEASASMLNLAKLEHPFTYTLEVLGENGPHTETVDLVETFNFLCGLHIQRIEAWRDDAGKRDYRAVKAKDRNGRRVLVLWRDMEKLDPAVERKFLEARLKKDGPFDEAWINGDCAVPGVQSLDGLFKRLLEEEER